MDMNKFTNKGYFIEITSHIDNKFIGFVEKTDLINVEWVQFSIETNENDINVMNIFYKKYPQIYLRFRNTLNYKWIKYLPDLQKFRFENFSNENIDIIKNNKVFGLYFELQISKKDDLTVLHQFSETLEELHLSGLIKNIDKIIVPLRQLKNLGFESVKMDNLNFLEGIKLEYFYNYGSRIKDFSYIGNIDTLKSLYLKTNTTLDNIDFIEKLSNLEKILLMYISKITYFPKLDNLKNIKSVILSYCNRISNIDELKKLNGVEIKVFGEKIKYKK
jgi:hypothetical protein